MLTLDARFRLVECSGEEDEAYEEGGIAPGRAGADAFGDGSGYGDIWDEGGDSDDEEGDEGGGAPSVTDLQRYTRAVSARYKRPLCIPRRPSSWLTNL